MEEALAPEARLIKRAFWLVRLRWAALLGVACVVTMTHCSECAYEYKTMKLTLDDPWYNRHRGLLYTLRDLTLLTLCLLIVFTLSGLITWLCMTPERRARMEAGEEVNIAMHLGASPCTKPFYILTGAINATSLFGYIIVVVVILCLIALLCIAASEKETSGPTIVVFPSIGGGGQQQRTDPTPLPAPTPKPTAKDPDFKSPLFNIVTDIAALVLGVTGYIMLYILVLHGRVINRVDWHGRIQDACMAPVVDRNQDPSHLL